MQTLAIYFDVPQPHTLYEYCECLHIKQVMLQCLYIATNLDHCCQTDKSVLIVFFVYTKDYIIFLQSQNCHLLAKIFSGHCWKNQAVKSKMFFCVYRATVQCHHLIHDSTP